MGEAVNPQSRAQLCKAAEVHHAHLVAQVPHDRQVVGDEQVGVPFLSLKAQEQVEDLRLHGDIKG